MQMIEVFGAPIMLDLYEFLVDLRRELNLEGLDLLQTIRQPATNNIQFTCPQHGDGKERKPSCGVLTKTVKEGDKVYKPGTIHCFTCGYTTHLAEFVSDCFSKKDAGMFGYKWLISRYVAVEVSHRKPLDLFVKDKVKQIEYITEEELDSYRYTHPYMYKRGFTDSIIEMFDVGYDKATDSLTFPVHDKQGRTLFIQRRSVKTKFFKNPDASLKSQTLYGIDMIYKYAADCKEIVVAESITDALTSWVYGKPAVSTLGCLATENQIRLLKQLPGRALISGYDNDQAGDDGTERLYKGLGSSKLLYRFEFPRGYKDLNEMSEEVYLNMPRKLY